MKLDFSQTLIMGIVNVTPDSFSDGGDFFPITSAFSHAQELLSQGADIIDIGGESTRPGAQKISLTEEMQRVIPLIQKLRMMFPTVLISIDTYKAEVAKKAIAAGATMINDVSGLQLDRNMASVAASCNVPIVITHMKGIPQTMQKGEIIYADIIQEISDFFAKQIAVLREAGVKQENIILDPGFGFGKTVAHNIAILQSLHMFKKFQQPLLIGISRKSTIGNLLQEIFHKAFAPKERLIGSLAATAVAVSNGAAIIRCHDVKETKQFVAILDRIKTQNI